MTAEYIKCRCKCATLNCIKLFEMLNSLLLPFATTELQWKPKSFNHNTTHARLTQIDAARTSRPLQHPPLLLLSLYHSLFLSYWGVQENQLRNDGSLVGGAKGKLNRRKTKAEAQNHKKHKINVIKNLPPPPRAHSPSSKKGKQCNFRGVCVRGHKGHKTISTPLNVQRGG